MKIFLPEKVNFIINKLKENGYEAYAVGGCVRDSVLGRVPMTGILRRRRLRMRRKHCLREHLIQGLSTDNYGAGRQRGVRGDNIPCRMENYEDSRHPKEVVFTRSLKEDLLKKRLYDQCDGI